MKYFIANWKANKTVYEAVSWATDFADILKAQPNTLQLLKEQQIKIIICPSMPYIFYIRQLLKEYQISFGAQDISQFEMGKHTGEVPASQLKGIIDYAIVGHSERRKELSENEDSIKLKVDNLQNNGIETILCVRNENDTIYEAASIVAYEPIEAIGNGHNMNVSDVLKERQKLLLQINQAFLYGGSVSSNDCKEYLQENQIDGFLIGTSSLDPNEFFKIIAQYTP